MAGVQGSALAIAVANAGGLGSLPCATLTIDAVRRELTTIAAQTTRPINVNFFCHPPPARDTAREQRWQQRLAPYYREFGITDIPPVTAGRTPFNDEAAAVIEEFTPRVVSFHFGLPEDRLLTRVRATGAFILSSATTVEEARWLEAGGADAVIAQGMEAGGHRGMFLTDELRTQVPALTLLEQILGAVRVPVIAAGGIADSNDVASALSAGAVAVQVGTAYLLCPEATTSVVHRAALRTTPALDTVITNVFTGRPARGLSNRVIREVGPISPDAPSFPLATSAMAPLRSAAEHQGSGDFSPMWAGTQAGKCREVPAEQLTRELAGARSA